MMETLRAETRAEIENKIQMSLCGGWVYKKWNLVTYQLLGLGKKELIKFCVGSDRWLGLH